MYYNYYLFYFIFLLASLIICNSISIFKYKYKYIVLIFSIFFLGQRWSSGVDFYGYLNYYIYDIKVEKGYYFIQSIFRENNLYFGLMIFICYVTTLLVSLKIFTKFCNNNTSIFIFFISEYHIMSINPLRTYLSLIFFIILCNMYILKKRSKIRTFFLLSLGFLFHKSIVLAAPFIFFIKKIPYKKYLLIGLFLIPLINIRELVKYTPYAGYYLGSVYDVKSSLLNHIKYYFTLVMYFYFKRKNNVKEEIENLFIVYLLLYGLSMNLGPIHRVAYFFKIYELIYFCEILNKKNISLKIWFDKGIILSFFISIYFAASYKDLGHMFLYKFRWIKLKNEVTFDEYQNEIIRYLNILDNRGKEAE